ncbi:MAG TPA: response regulator transcription factor [Aggregatilineales bacterium]|nr:response regulator transcription factor [Aggregatilineales bacterium]
MENKHSPTGLHNISVMIVDDHPIMREGLRKLLEDQDDLKVIAEAMTGPQALEMARDQQPDVVLLDINLPDMNGIQVTSKLKAERSKIAVILLTAYDDDEQVLHAMRAGASAYCPKDVEPERLLNVIRQVAKGNYIIRDKVYNERGVQDWINAAVDALSGPYVMDSGEHFVPLSPREMEILRCVTRGLSNKEIASELGISHQTVKNHMTSILDKLNVDDRTQAAVYALQRGWVRVTEYQRPASEDDDTNND